MKQVYVKIPDSGITLLENVTEDKCYGILLYKRDKGFITRSDFDKGDWQSRCMDDITRANKWGNWNIANKWGNWNVDHHKTIEALISKLITEKFKVYEFDTPQELFKWLSE